MTPIIAIDPGITPTICLWERDGTTGLTFCESGTAEGICLALEKWKRKHPSVKAVIEKVAMRPGEDINSGSRFVGSMWMMHGICTALTIPLAFMDPAKWKMAMRAPGKGVPRAKETLCEMAGNTFPDSRWLFATPNKHHNRADAALLAYFYATRYVDYK